VTDRGNRVAAKTQRSRHLHRGWGAVVAVRDRWRSAGHTWELALTALRRGRSRAFAGPTARWIPRRCPLPITGCRLAADPSRTTRSRHRLDGRCRCLIGWCQCWRPRRPARPAKGYLSARPTARRPCGVQRGRRALLTRGVVPLLAWHGEGGGSPAHQAARRPTYLRDADAPPRGTRRGNAAWIGHEDASLTMRLYAHSQDDALRMAGESLNRLVATRDTEAR